MHNFHPRQREILKILSEKKTWVKGSELAIELGVTDRTVRNDISFINSILNEEFIVSQNKKGYFLSDLNRAREIMKSESEGIPTHPDERINYILKNLLLKSREIDLYNLSEKLMVSEATIENDLKRIKEMISENQRGLSLSRKAALIYLSGSEKDKRALLSELLFKETNRSFFSLLKYEKYFNDFSLALIQRKLIESVKKYNIHLNEMAVVNLVIHIAITIDRIKSENILDIQFDLDSVEGTPEYKMSEDLSRVLEEELGVKFPLGDIIYLSYLILGKSIIKNNYKEKRELDGIVDPNLSSLTDELIHSIKMEYGIYFENDDQLFIGLCLHIKRMIERIHNHIIMRNPILDELKINYPFIFEIAVFVSKEFYRITGLAIREDEIGFLALHLGAAFERLKEKKTGKRKIGLICPTGYITSSLLMTKLHSVYKDKVEILGTYSFMELDELIANEPDLILSTVKFDYEIDIKVIEVSPFLNQADIEKIDQHLRLYKEYKGQNDVSTDVRHFFRRDIFYKGISFTDEFEAIQFLGNDLYSKGYTPEDYMDLVMEREKISSTSYGNLVAIPHPIVMNAYETVISVAILNKPVMWGKNRAQLVFMFSLKEEDRKKLNHLYKHLIEIINRPDGVNHLIGSEHFDDFIARIINYNS
ncbi:BglG family transcription antiterminator [Peribacillus alkalitolerans]|uniref:BglG family transcription antiterminator n=1 Tax=Peribacillus alkalitolerans TaxID=1550385 RepID=UPI0013D22FFD|nr:BglG family transcription antiterminator [Peribacillus alkalitolerans]